MIVNVVGIKNVDYTNKDGKRIIGVNLYVTYKDSNVRGEVAESVWLGSAFDTSMIMVGSKISLETNLKGHIINVTPVKA